MTHKTHILLRFVFFVLTTALLQAQNQKPMKNKFTPDQNQVLHVVEQMTTAFHNKNLEAVMATYASNALVIFEPEKPISDHNILRTMFTQAFTINPQFTYSGHEVFINGNLATHFAPWTMTGVAPDGSTITQSGLSVALLKKQENGKWLIIFDNPHSDFLMPKL